MLHILWFNLEPPSLSFPFLPSSPSIKCFNGGGVLRLIHFYNPDEQLIDLFHLSRTATYITLILSKAGQGMLGFPNGKRIMDELVTILISLRGNDIVKLKEFTHDLLPVTFFVMDTNFTNLFSPLSNLTVLRLNIHATWWPLARLWVGLAELLKAAPSLEGLCFGFSPLEKDFFGHPA